VAHVQGEAAGVARVLRQPVQPLYVHAAAAWTVDPPALELHVHDRAGHPQITGTAYAPVVAAAAAVTAVGTHSRFFRRRRITIRVLGSPNTPVSVAAATNPGNESDSRRLRPDFTGKSCSQGQCRNRLPSC